jgi:hypothetical protein
MGIMDSNLLKFGIEILTAFINGINTITGLLEPLGLDGAAKIGLVVAALYLGAKALDVFTGAMRTGTSMFGSFHAVGSAAIKGINNQFSKLNRTITLVTGKPVKIDTKAAQVSVAKYTKANKEAAKAVAERNAIEKNTAMTQETRSARMEELNKKETLSEKAKT